MTIDQVKYYEKICKKDDDKLLLYIDKSKNIIYRRSYSGLVFEDMTASLKEYTGWSILQFAKNSKNILIKYKEL